LATVVVGRGAEPGARAGTDGIAVAVFEVCALEMPAHGGLLSDNPPHTPASVLRSAGLVNACGHQFGRPRAADSYNGFCAAGTPGPGLLVAGQELADPGPHRLAVVAVDHGPCHADGIAEEEV